MTGAATAVGSINSTNVFGIDSDTTTAADDLFGSAGDTHLTVGDNSGNGEIVLTLTLSNAADQNDAILRHLLKLSLSA